MTIPAVVQPYILFINEMIESFENEEYGKVSDTQKYKLKEFKKYLNYL